MMIAWMMPRSLMTSGEANIGVPSAVTAVPPDDLTGMHVESIHAGPWPAAANTRGPSATGALRTAPPNRWRHLTTPVSRSRATSQPSPAPGLRPPNRPPQGPPPRRRPRLHPGTGQGLAPAQLPGLELDERHAALTGACLTARVGGAAPRRQHPLAGDRGQAEVIATTLPAISWRQIGLPG